MHDGRERERTQISRTICPLARFKAFLGQSGELLGSDAVLVKTEFLDGHSEEERGKGKREEVRGRG